MLMRVDAQSHSCRDADVELARCRNDVCLCKLFCSSSQSLNPELHLFRFVVSYNRPHDILTCGFVVDELSTHRESVAPGVLHARCRGNRSATDRSTWSMRLTDAVQLATCSFTLYGAHRSSLTLTYDRAHRSSTSIESPAQHT